jgi:3'-5' exoribonuclease
MTMNRLPRIRDLEAGSSGWGFFLCAKKEVRSGKNGEYLALVLQDTSGEVGAKIFQDVDALKQEFDAGEFVKVQGRGNSFNQRLELIVDKIRRVMPDQDGREGFREEDCIPCAPRPITLMWAELLGRIEAVTDPHIRALLDRMVAQHEERLRIWPAAKEVHHAYRGGLLEHILKISEIALYLADAYGAKRDVVFAGVLLHDIGKLQELTYDITTGYSIEGNLVGHIVIGVGLLRDAMRDLPGFPPALLLELEHLILSHHGSREMGSPVVPMTIEAFILAASDDLDAKIHQVRRSFAEDDSDGAFTSYHKRLGRVLYKPSES